MLSFCPKAAVFNRIIFVYVFSDIHHNNNNYRYHYHFYCFDNNDNLPSWTEKFVEIRLNLQMHLFNILKSPRVSIN